MGTRLPYLWEWANPTNGPFRAAIWNLRRARARPNGDAMQIKVTGKQIDVGEALMSHVEGRLGAAIGKYFDRPAEGSVVFSRDAHNFKCDSSVHLATGLKAQARASSTDIYAAFDQAAERIEKQVRRYKRRLKNHHHERQNPVEIVQAQSYVLAAHPDEGGEEAEPESLQPVIIAEAMTDIQALTAGEAVMQMELADQPFLVFQNSGNGRINVVFRRDDGNVGWIDPATSENAG